MNRWNGHTPVRVCLICKHCGKDYQVPAWRAEKSKFCSKACYDNNQTTAEKKEIICQQCSVKFESKKDHGVWPKFCSRECFGADAPTPMEKECPICSSVFLATRSSHQTEDGLRTYCSVKCAKQHLRNGEYRKCLNCEKEFYLNKSKQRQRPDEGCCSQQCASEFYIGMSNQNWKGGRYVDYEGKSILLFSRPDRISKYVPEHRVVAMKAIGRLLDRTETVIRINNITLDNRPENIFICKTYGEFRKRKHGTLPWPKKSNLTSYK